VEATAEAEAGVRAEAGVAEDVVATAADRVVAVATGVMEADGTKKLGVPKMRKGRDDCRGLFLQLASLLVFLLGRPRRCLRRRLMLYWRHIMRLNCGCSRVRRHRRRMRRIRRRVGRVIGGRWTWHVRLWSG